MLTQVTDSILYAYPLPIQTDSTPLFRASFAGNIDEVKDLLKGGADVNETNDVSLVHLIW